MSLIETFGGTWVSKQTPSRELMDKWKKQAELLKNSDCSHKRCSVLVAEGTQAKAYLKDLGDGKYCAGISWKDLSYECEFKLDGKPVKITGHTDGKEMTATHAFKDGVWKTIISREGAPDLVIERQRKGDEVHSKETVGDLVIEQVAVKET